MERVKSFKFLGVYITNALSRSKHTKTVVKRARQNLFPLRRLKRFDMGPQILKKFYSCTIECILTSCIIAWYGYCSASDHKALQRVVWTAQYITGAKLPDIQSPGVFDTHNCSLCYRTASDTGAPSLEPKGSLTASTPKAIRLLNNESTGHLYNLH